jgi:hypothetical protein
VGSPYVLQGEVRENAERGKPRFSKTSEHIFLKKEVKNFCL